MIVEAKQYLKMKFRQARHLYLGTFHAFSTADFKNALHALGVNSGDTLLIHSSYDAFQGFSGRPSDVISAFQQAVGTEGTLLMPTLPFGGTAVDYARSSPLFDVKRTPSRMGLLSELFRRSPGVIRSVHPTHPVAAWGRQAAMLVDSHHLAETPCGPSSPYARLLDMQGKILLVGTDIGALTFYHTIEALLEQKFPVTPFTAEIFTLQSRDHSGTLLTTRTRLFEPAVSRRRNLYKLIPALKSANAWRERRVGHMSLFSLKTEDVLSTVAAMAAQGEYCYD